MYEYQATVTKVVDGDTLHVRLDLGLDVRIDTTLRLAGLNAPEMSTPEGQAAKVFVEDWLASMGRPSVRDQDGNFLVLVRTAKDRREKYGRYLAGVFSLDGQRNLNRDLVEAGHAVESTGRRAHGE